DRDVVVYLDVSLADRFLHVVDHDRFAGRVRVPSGAALLEIVEARGLQLRKLLQHRVAVVVPLYAEHHLVLAVLAKKARDFVDLVAQLPGFYKSPEPVDLPDLEIVANPADLYHRIVAALDAFRGIDAD